ncbi:hypothetical protein HKX48_008286 [Thoreauomyces humboldtii]|nr:hypothetical protein HKX48_008286 [Thoreauomyces humboldtii]
MPQEYNGPRTAKGIVDAAIGKLANHVIPIGGKGKRASTYDDFVAQSDLPRVVFASAKSATPPLMKALSTEYLGRIAFAEVKSTDTDNVAKINVTSFPSVLLFPKGSEEALVYEGAMKLAGLTEFFDKYAAKRETSSSGKSSKGSKKPTAKKETPPAAVPAEVVEATSQSDVDACLSKPGFCAITFVIHEPEYPESTAAHLETLALLQKTAAQHPGFRYLWIDAQKHEAHRMMRDLGMSDMLPGLVVVNGPKNVYRVLTGPFDEAGLKAFLKDVSNGKGRFFKMQEKPTLGRTVKEKVKEKVKETVEDVKDGAAKTAEKARDAVEDAREKVVEAKEEAGRTVEELVKAVKEKAAEAKDKASGLADDAQAAVQDAAEKVMTNASETAESTKSAGADAAASAGSKVAEAHFAADEAARRTKLKVTEGADEARHVVREAAEKVQGKMHEAAAEAEEAMRRFKEKVSREKEEL